jgi:hypothetical protein
MKAAFRRVDQPRSAQDLQVLRSVRNRNAGLTSQCLYRARSLTQQLKQFKAFWGRNRLADSRELFVDTILELPIRLDHAEYYSSIRLNSQVGVENAFFAR